MKNLNKLIFLLCALSFTVSCIKDNSGVGNVNLNKIEISGLKDNYTASLGEVLNIEPTVTTTDDDVSYVWYTYNMASGDTRDTLSTEKDFSVVISGSRVIPGIEYSFVYRVIDNATGVYESHTMTLTSESDYTKGAVVLCETEGQVELNMIKRDGTILKDVYGKNNETPLDNTFDRVIFSNPDENKTFYKSIFLFANNQDGGYVLDPVTLSAKRTIRDYLDGDVSAETLHPTYWGKAGMIDYMIINGKVHKRTSNMSDLLFQSAALVAFGGAADYSVPAFLSEVSSPLMFDELNGRMLIHSPWYAGAIVPANEDISDMTEFDINDMGDVEYIASGYINDFTYWLMGKERTTGDTIVYKFENNRSNGTLSFKALDKFVLSASAAPNFSADKGVVSNYWVQGLAFYTSGDKIYALNMNTLSSSSSTLAEAVLIDLEAENMTITGLEFPSIEIPAENPGESNFISDQIRVYVQDNSLNELPGGVIMYDISARGGISATENSRYVGGYCDRVIDIDEKLS